MAEGGSTSRKKKSASLRPPQNFVVTWKEDEDGPTLGYAITELVAYFPVAVGNKSKSRGLQNVADPAFADLFAPGGEKQVLLKAVPLPDGIVGDSSFRVEVAGMSGDNRHKDAG